MKPILTRRFMMGAAIAFGLLGGNAGALQAQETTPISFRLDWSIYGSHAPFYLALQEGLYKEAGLDVTIGEGQGSATVVQLIAQGADPIGFVDFGTMAQGVEKGMPVIAVARVLSNVMCVISPKDAPINSPAELAGKVVAYGPAESTGLVFPALLASENVDPDSISVINPATAAKNTLLLQGRADAIPANYNVQVAQLEAAGMPVHYFPMSDYGIEQMNNGLVANTDFLADNPEAVVAFVAATAKGFEMAQADPEAAVDALIAALPEQDRNRDILLHQLKLTFPSLTTEATEGKPFGWMEASDWEATQDVMFKYVGLPRELPVETFYTNEFVGER